MIITIKENSIFKIDAIKSFISENDIKETNIADIISKIINDTEAEKTFWLDENGEPDYQGMYCGMLKKMKNLLSELIQKMEKLIVNYDYINAAGFGKKIISGSRCSQLRQ